MSIWKAVSVSVIISLQKSTDIAVKKKIYIETNGLTMIEYTYDKYLTFLLN